MEQQEIIINGKSYFLIPGVYAVGRLGDEPFKSALRGCFYVSRKHCKIEIKTDGNVTVQDIGSLNGSYINGEIIDTSVLEPGNSLTLGDEKEDCVGAASIEIV